jgi:hypothetical protein
MPPLEYNKEETTVDKHATDTDAQLEEDAWLVDSLADLAMLSHQHGKPAEGRVEPSSTKRADAAGTRSSKAKRNDALHN